MPIIYFFLCFMKTLISKQYMVIHCLTRINRKRVWFGMMKMTVSGINGLRCQQQTPPCHPEHGKREAPLGRPPCEEPVLNVVKESIGFFQRSQGESPERWSGDTFHVYVQHGKYGCAAACSCVCGHQPTAPAPLPGLGEETDEILRAAEMVTSHFLPPRSFT